MDGFRIVAPTAVQAAALEKNYSPHAGPVMDAEMLNIKNIRFYAHFPVTHTSLIHALIRYKQSLCLLIPGAFHCKQLHRLRQSPRYLWAAWAGVLW